MSHGKRHIPLACGAPGRSRAASRARAPATPRSAAGAPAARSGKRRSKRSKSARSVVPTSFAEEGLGAYHEERATHEVVEFEGALGVDRGAAEPGVEARLRAVVEHGEGGALPVRGGGPLHRRRALAAEEPVTEGPRRDLVGEFVKRQIALELEHRGVAVRVEHEGHSLPGDGDAEHVAVAAAARGEKGRRVAAELQRRPQKGRRPDERGPDGAGVIPEGRGGDEGSVAYSSMRRAMAAGDSAALYTRKSRI